MGNFNTNKYQASNYPMSSKKSHSIFSGLGCSILGKKIKKGKCNDPLKSKSLSFDECETLKNINVIIQKDNIIDASKNKDSMNSCNSLSDLNETNPIDNGTKFKNETLILTIKCPEALDKPPLNFSQSVIYENNSKDKVIRSYPRLSESSLNSDDLMLSTDVNLDQADDDVSKDYNTSEKDDPFIYENIKNNKRELTKTDNNSKSVLINSIDAIADESERNDIVSFDSSRESSASTQRKSFSKGFSLRPHSFSSPLRPNPRDSKSFGKRNSNLSTVDSVDLAWTWISTSETANLSQDVSNLKLMLLKMKRLLLDETYNEGFLSNSRIDTFHLTSVSNVFSEPSTPNCNNNILNPSQVDSFMPQNRQWETMSKEMLIQELHDLFQQNGDLQYQLKEKSRIIEFLQDQQQNYKNYPRRLHSSSSKTEISNRRITRSSTFETASTLNNQAFCQDPEFSFSNSHDTKIVQSEPKQSQ